jgi:hypothetical protein
MGSVVLPHLRSGWHVDQAILSEEERLVVIRFGKDSNPDCMRQDELLYRIADRVKNFAVIYLCDNSEGKHFSSFLRCRAYADRVDSQGLQHHVRTLRPDDDHVLLPQQAYDVRFRHWQ